MLFALRMRPCCSGKIRSTLLHVYAVATCTPGALMQVQRIGASTGAPLWVVR